MDLQKLNKHQSDQPTIPQPTTWELVYSIPKQANYFAVFDALKGYHHIPLEEDLRDKTKFNTPFGKFCYCCIPMGFTLAGDIFIEPMGRAIDKTLDWKLCCVEDCCLYGSTEAELLEKIEKFFEL